VDGVDGLPKFLYMEDLLQLETKDGDEIAVWGQEGTVGKGLSHVERNEGRCFASVMLGAWGLHGFRNKRRAIEKEEGKPQKRGSWGRESKLDGETMGGVLPSGRKRLGEVGL